MRFPVFALLVGAAYVCPAFGQTNAASDALRRMTEPERIAALNRFLTQSGESCDVTRTFFQGVNKSDGSAFWNVACRNGGALSIMVSADAGGSTRITDCGVMKAVANVECFKPFED